MDKADLRPAFVKRVEKVMRVCARDAEQRVYAMSNEGVDDDLACRV